MFHVLASLLYYFRSPKNPSSLMEICVTFSLSHQQFSDFSRIQLKEASHHCTHHLHATNHPCLLPIPPQKQSLTVPSSSFFHYWPRPHNHQPFFPPLHSITIHREVTSLSTTSHLASITIFHKRFGRGKAKSEQGESRKRNHTESITERKGEHYLRNQR